MSKGTPASKLARQKARRLADTTRCSKCGAPPGPLPVMVDRIHVHHIDGNPLNNDPANLQPLCHSCHCEAHGKMTSTACIIPGCGGKHVARGYCTKHWERWNTCGDPLAVTTNYRRRVAYTCSVAGCGRTHMAKGLCAKHYRQARKPK